jgi:tetratricopeptide (TPR) repeat protein
LLRAKKIPAINSASRRPLQWLARKWISIFFYKKNSLTTLKNRLDLIYDKTLSTRILLACLSLVSLWSSAAVCAELAVDNLRQETDISVSDTLSTDRQRRAAAYTQLGRAHFDARDGDGAVRAYQLALRSAPNYAETYFQLALTLKAHGAIPMTVRVLRTYIRIESDSTRVERARDIISSFGLKPPPTPAAALLESGYIGAETCGECHPAKYKSFRETAHHQTSHLANAETIHGEFSGDAAVMWTRDPNLWFEMKARADGFYQTANTLSDGNLHEQSERFDIVIGSGKIGQSYLYWQGDRLFQLPVSHYSDSDQWINSPGFRDGEAFFERPIIARCLECHSTFFQSLQHGKNIHGKSAFALGISCERCHGPGAQHAEFHNQLDGAPIQETIVHPGQLSRKQLIDLCAQCHSSTGVPQKPPFAFRPGDALEDHYAADSGEQRGVHAANQVGRLAAAKCFQQSEDMTCITCHNPHELERGNTQLFSSRCLQCHEVDVCAMGPELGAAIRDNCIDCHMPRSSDKKTQIQGTGSGLDFPLMPEHRIAIYPEATQRFLARQKTPD